MLLKSEHFKSDLHFGDGFEVLSIILAFSFLHTGQHAKQKAKFPYSTPLFFFNTWPTLVLTLLWPVLICLKFWIISSLTQNTDFIHTHHQSRIIRNFMSPLQKKPQIGYTFTYSYIHTFTFQVPPMFKVLSSMLNI